MITISKEQRTQVKIAVDKLKVMSSCIFNHETGSGKTRMSLHAVDELNCDRILIVATKQLRDVWKKEVHSDTREGARKIVMFKSTKPFQDQTITFPPRCAVIITPETLHSELMKIRTNSLAASPLFVNGTQTSFAEQLQSSHMFDDMAQMSNDLGAQETLLLNILNRQQPHIHKSVSGATPNSTSISKTDRANMLRKIALIGDPVKLVHQIKANVKTSARSSTWTDPLGEGLAELRYNLSYFFPVWDAIIVDEIHNFRNGDERKKYLDVGIMCSLAKYTIGLSATLYHNKWKDLESVTKLMSAYYRQRKTRRLSQFSSSHVQTIEKRGQTACLHLATNLIINYVSTIQRPYAIKNEGNPANSISYVNIDPPILHWYKKLITVAERGCKLYEACLKSTMHLKEKKSEIITCAHPGCKSEGEYILHHINGTHHSSATDIWCITHRQENMIHITYAKKRRYSDMVFERILYSQYLLLDPRMLCKISDHFSKTKPDGDFLTHCKCCVCRLHSIFGLSEDNSGSNHHIYSDIRQMSCGHFCCSAHQGIFESSVLFRECCNGDINIHAEARKYDCQVCAWESQFAAIPPKVRFAIDSAIRHLDSDGFAVCTPFDLKKQAVRLSSSPSCCPGGGVVLMSKHRGTLDAIERGLRILKDSSKCANTISGNFSRWSRIDGSINVEEREHHISNFNSGKTRLMLATLGVGGEGINLQGGNMIIFLESGWTYANIKQAHGRIDRMHIQPCSEISFEHVLTRGTIEIPHFELILQKRDDELNGMDIELSDYNYRTGLITAARSLMPLLEVSTMKQDLCDVNYQRFELELEVYRGHTSSNSIQCPNTKLNGKKRIRCNSELNETQTNKHMKIDENLTPMFKRRDRSYARRSSNSNTYANY